MYFRTLRLILVTSLMSFVLHPQSVCADSIDDGLSNEHAKPIYQFLKKKGYSTVAVLNFAVTREGIDQVPNYQAGPISRNLAIRLQNALAYRSIAPGKMLNIVNNAGAVIENKGINSINTMDQREGLFAIDFSPVLAESDESNKLKADVFITGEVILAADKKTTQIQLKYFDNDKVKEPKKFYNFTVPTDEVILTEVGVSFALQAKGPIFDNLYGKNQHRLLGGEASIKTPSTTKPRGSETGRDPKTNGSNTTEPPIVIVCPPNEIVWNDLVDLQILYDDVPQVINRHSTDKEKYSVSEPKEGQKVMIKIKNKTTDKLGVVFFVNKVNVMNSESIENRKPSEYSKLILHPSGTSTDEWVVRGYYKFEGGKFVETAYEPFKIASDDETKKLLSKEIGKSNYFGHFTMYVFKSGAGDTSASAENRAKTGKSDSDLEYRKFLEGRNSSTFARDLGEATKSRGAVGGSGESAQQKLTEESIENPLQLAAISIRYLKFETPSVPGVEVRKPKN